MPRQPILAVTTCCALLGAGSSTPSLIMARQAPTAAAAVVPSPTTHAAGDGRRWLKATLAALDDAKEVRLPFADNVGELDAAHAAVAYAFRGHGGQPLEIELRRDASSSGPIYVEVFRVLDVLGEPLHERLTALRPSASRIKTRLPSDGVYHVLVQSGAEGAGHYGLTLELGASLPFPVVGAEAGSIRGLFGASRDAGRRHHAGVDIFVQRLTPVLAVAPGIAMPRHDELGGNTVWLNTPGTSYYYAHLDRIAVRDQQRVKVGDVLGYVGNTGNANGVPSHLHFGVYRWGREPIDPLPLLVGQRLGQEQRAKSAANAGGG
ncbi:MAG TPA: M23 family metallopeptidase [Gammaproteobacteria bacterium]